MKFIKVITMHSHHHPLIETECKVKGPLSLYSVSVSGTKHSRLHTEVSLTCPISMGVCFEALLKVRHAAGGWGWVEGVAPQYLNRGALLDCIVFMCSILKRTSN